jgi:hypothetical protein
MYVKGVLGNPRRDWSCSHEADCEVCQTERGLLEGKRSSTPGGTVMEWPDA